MRSGTSEACSPSSPPAPSASRCSRRARAATTRRRSTRPPRPLSSTGSSTLDQDFTLVSEELGERVFGTGAPWRVVCDPIDGSLNAKRDIPFFSLSLAVADGAAMGDVVFGYVYDFGTGEEWTAERGRGAFLNGERLGAVRAEGRDRDPLVRGDHDRPGRGQGSRDGRDRVPPPDHGLARNLALPPRRGSRRRRLLAQARTLGRHRGRPAARARVRPRDRAVRGPAVRVGSARPRRTFTSRRRGNDRAVPHAGSRTYRHRLLGGYPHGRPERRSSTSTTTGRDSPPGTRFGFANCWQRTAPE